MYYDLIASLPRLPYFQQAERLPISRYRLDQRLRLLNPAHADQLIRAQSLVRWRADRMRSITDASQVAKYNILMASSMEPSLQHYVAFRMDQQTMLAALRRKREGKASLEDASPWGVGPWFRHILAHWDVPGFGLVRLYPWLPQAQALLAEGDAKGLERLLMDIAWRQLDRYAERNMFSFDAVFSYVFKWDILQAWLACDADKGKARFKDLIDKVTHAEPN